MVCWSIQYDTALVARKNRRKSGAYLHFLATIAQEEEHRTCNAEPVPLRARLVAPPYLA